MSGNVSTDYLAAIKAYLEGPLVADPDVARGQRRARVEIVCESLELVIRDPGAAWLEIDSFRAMVANQPAQNEQLMKALDAGRA